MKISELEAQLKELREKHGDLCVKTFKNNPLDGIYDGPYVCIRMKDEIKYD